MGETKILKVNGHRVSVQRKKSECIVTVDEQEGKTFAFNKTSKWLGISEDFQLMIDGNPCIVVLRGRDVRLAKNGFYIDNGSVYTETKPVPKWLWFFAILNFLIIPISFAIFFPIIKITIPVSLSDANPIINFAVIISIGVLIPIFLALAGAKQCTSVVRFEKTLVTKIILCIIITIIVWVICSLIFIFMCILGIIFGFVNFVSMFGG